MVTDENITKYQDLYRARFGREISREEAREQGTRLVRLMQLVYQPMTQEEYDETVDLQKRLEKLPK